MIQKISVDVKINVNNKYQHDLASKTQTYSAFIASPDDDTNIADMLGADISNQINDALTVILTVISAKYSVNPGMDNSQDPSSGSLEEQPDDEDIIQEPYVTEIRPVHDSENNHNMYRVSYDDDTDEDFNVDKIPDDEEFDHMAHDAIGVSRSDFVSMFEGYLRS